MILFQIFGSPSSKDYDILVFVDELGTIQENHELIDQYNHLIAYLLKENGFPEKEMNCNLGVLKNGMLVDVFKGYVFEVNNSLYNTYSLHKEQLCANYIERPYEWTEAIADYKLKRCFRFILSFYSRIPEWRADIKEALRGGFDKRLACIKKIDFTIHKEFPGKKDNIDDIYKTFAFQIAQTHALLSGLELYSKEQVIEHYPFFENMIMRKGVTDDDLQKLNIMLLSLIQVGEIKVKTMPNLLEEL